MESLFIITLLVLGFGSVSGRLASSPLTSPIVFMGTGVLLSALHLIPTESMDGVLHVVAQFTLVILLFTDASQIDGSALRRGFSLPLRLLAVGLPLSIALGGVLAALLFPGFGWAEALLLGAILAPTDAALGQVVVTSSRVPERIRRTLRVESGLNDGIVFPAVVLLCALAAPAIHDDDGWGTYVALQLTMGPIAGVVIGLLGGRLLTLGTRSGWMSAGFRQISMLALALAAFSGAELIGGNGIIAAFVGGLTVGNTARELRESMFEFAENEGQLLMLVAFLLMGAILVGPAFEAIDAATVAYALVSLTVVRMIPVALSLLGTGLRLPSVLFLGWFGPRGLASIVFALFVVHHGLPAGDRLLGIVVVTVALSTLLHGLSAARLAAIYGRFADRIREACNGGGPIAPECQPIDHSSSKFAQAPQREHAFVGFWIGFAGRMGVPLVVAPVFAGLLDWRFEMPHLAVFLGGSALSFFHYYSGSCRDV